MTKRDIADIALKIIGIYMLTLAVDSLVNFAKSTTYFLHPNTVEGTEDLIYLTSNTFRTLFYTFGFWLLTFKTNKVVGKLFRSNTDSTIALDQHGILQVTLSAAGLLITFSAISSFWYQTMVAGLWDLDFVKGTKWALTQVLLICAPATKGILGLSLIIWSGRIAKWITRKNKKEKTEPNKELS